MAGDAGLSSEEIEFLRREDLNRKKNWTRDYMLLFFWVTPHPPPPKRGAGLTFRFRCWCVFWGLRWLRGLMWFVGGGLEKG